MYWITTHGTKSPDNRTPQDTGKLRELVLFAVQRVQLRLEIIYGPSGGDYVHCDVISMARGAFVYNLLRVEPMIQLLTNPMGAFLRPHIYSVERAAELLFFRWAEWRKLVHAQSCTAK